MEIREILENGLKKLNLDGMVFVRIAAYHVIIDIEKYNEDVTYYIGYIQDDDDFLIQELKRVIVEEGIA